MRPALRNTMILTTSKTHLYVYERNLIVQTIVCIRVCVCVCVTAPHNLMKSQCATTWSLSHCRFVVHEIWIYPAGRDEIAVINTICTLWCVCMLMMGGWLLLCVFDAARRRMTPRAVVFTAVACVLRVALSHLPLARSRPHHPQNIRITLK